MHHYNLHKSSDSVFCVSEWPYAPSTQKCMQSSSPTTIDLITMRCVTEILQMLWQLIDDVSTLFIINTMPKSALLGTLCGEPLYVPFDLNICPKSIKQGWIGEYILNWKSVFLHTEKGYQANHEEDITKRRCLFGTLLQKKTEKSCCKWSS